MREVQYELLRELREKVERGKSIIEEALKGTDESRVEISGVLVERRQLESFYGVLKKMSETSEVEELKTLLYEGVVPPELAVVSRFWERLQKLIHDSYKAIKG